MNTTTLTRLGAVTALAGTALLLNAGAASAHVTVDPTVTDSGAYTVLTFSNGHGCEGSPTTELTISIPDGIYSVSPTRQPYYDIEKVMEELDEPVDDGHGGQYTERVSEVVYTANTPLPDGQRDAFELSLKLPEDEAGTKLEFPAIQTCEEGETAWIEETVEGEPEPDTPAPFIVLTEAGGEADAASAGEAEDASTTDDAAAEGQDEGASDEESAGGETSAASTAQSGSSPLAWAGLGLGALGAALGGTALARSGKKGA